MVVHGHGHNPLYSQLEDGAAKTFKKIETPGSASGPMVPLLQDMLVFDNWQAACMSCTSMEQSSRPQRMAHMYRIIRKKHREQARRL